MVGAGALGQVFGLWLTKAGASVTYEARQKTTNSDIKTLYRLRRFARPVPEELRARPYPADGVWDAVWLCVPSPALHEPWVRDLRERVGAATVVTIGQDPRDLPALAGIWPAEQIVQLVPSVLAHRTPAGIAYWSPPGTAHTVHGTDDRARPVVTALRAAGVRVRRARRPGTAELGAARMIPYLAALEAADWSLPALRADLTTPATATREAVTVTAALLHRPPPRLNVPAPAANLILRALPALAPFDLPRYLRTHFTKVGTQTRKMLDTWITEGTSRNLPVTALTALRESLPHH
nr:2-dehydropantoate 2-reductase [Streptomyces paludis]